MHSTFILLLMQLLATGHQAGKPYCLNRYSHHYGISKVLRREVKQPFANCQATYTDVASQARLA